MTACTFSAVTLTPLTNIGLKGPERLSNPSSDVNSVFRRPMVCVKYGRYVVSAVRNTLPGSWRMMSYDGCSLDEALLVYIQNERRFVDLTMKVRK